MAEYTQAIFAGLRARGFSDSDVGRAIAASTARLHALLDGRFELTDRELDRVEDLADRTAGQLAVEGGGPHYQGLSPVMDAWAAVRTAAKRAAGPAPTPKVGARRRRA